MTIDVIRAERDLAKLAEDQRRHTALADLDYVDRRRKELHEDIDRARKVNAPAVLAGAWAFVDRVSPEIARADAKAGFAAPIQLAVLGAVAGGIAGIGGALQVVAGALLLAGVVLAVLVVLPWLPRRFPAGDGAADWLQFGAVGKMDPADLAKWLSSEISMADAACMRAVRLSRIAYRKHQLICWSVLTGVAGVLTAAMAAAIGGW